MATFSFSDPIHRRIRAYRTRAIIAALYAQDSTLSTNQRAWAYVAESWTDLADLTERAYRSPLPDWPRPWRAA